MNIIELFEDIVVDDSYDSDYTIEEAAMLIDDAKSRGFAIPKKLTPELYLKMYNSHKKIRSKEYLMEICMDHVENCITDIIGIDGAREYLLDMKLNGYSVPAMLTPELFLKLYNEYNYEGEECNED